MENENKQIDKIGHQAKKRRHKKSRINRQTKYWWY